MRKKKEVEKNMKKLVVFDLDGTLVDTLGDLAGALNHGLTECGFPTLTEHQVSAIVGHSVPYMCQNAVPKDHEGDWQKVMTVYNAYYRKHCCDLSRPYEGILKAVMQIKAAGVKMAVVSNKPHAFAVQVINGLFPRDTFNMILGRMERFATKPAPDALNFAMTYFGVDRADAVYVGDSEVDVEFARNAGLPCISCSWGFRTLEELRAAGAEHIIHDPGELPETVL